jgi:hypothetical protein
MLLLARYCFLCVEFSDFYANQYLAGQMLENSILRLNAVRILRLYLYFGSSKLS